MKFCEIIGKLQPCIRLLPWERFNAEYIFRFISFWDAGSAVQQNSAAPYEPAAAHKQQGGGAVNRALHRLPARAQRRLCRRIPHAPVFLLTAATINLLYNLILRRARRRICFFYEFCPYTYKTHTKPQLCVRLISTIYLPQSHALQISFGGDEGS